MLDPAANHNGGGLAFGPDGYLYISMGDGGGQDDQYGNGQNLNTLLGKLLRIDVDGSAAAGRAYAIPPPTRSPPRGGAPEIWAYGLRNPWRFSFDREWGDLFIGDVGGGAWEEINRQPADGPGGLNYGWPIMEGRHCLDRDLHDHGFVQPIAEYDHGSGCSVIGGYVYRGHGPARAGRGLRVRRLVLRHPVHPPGGRGNDHARSRSCQSGLAVSSFGEDDSGEIYLVDFAGGGLYHVVVP